MAESLETSVHFFLEIVVQEGLMLVRRVHYVWLSSFGLTKVLSSAECIPHVSCLYACLCLYCLCRASVYAIGLIWTRRASLAS